MTIEYIATMYSVSNIHGVSGDAPLGFAPLVSHEEYQYLNLIKSIFKYGSFEEGRNGKVQSIFGNMMRFSLRDGTLPLLTTKKVAWKTCFKELMWFIRGETDNQILKEQGVHIWDANGTREFLDSRGLTEYEEDELGPIYGWQWRSFNKSYYSKAYQKMASSLPDEDGCDDHLESPGIDQLQQIIDALKDPNQRTSRRLIMTAWNPQQLSQMALPPCHVLCQFNVSEGKYLSCALYQRSGDVGLGVPFNIASYSMLTHILAHHCGLEADSFVYFLGNAHIYEEHREALKMQQERVPRLPFPKIRFTKQHEKVDDYCLDDIKFLRPYGCENPIKMEMKA